MTRCLASLVAALMCGAAAFSTASARQTGAPADGPMSLAQIRSGIGLTRLPGSPLTFVQLTADIRRRGVTFILTVSEEAELRQLGAPENLIRLLGPPRSPAERQFWKPLTDDREMGWAPAGRLRMGSPPEEAGRDPSSEIQGDVPVASFWLDRTEVSNDAYRRFVRAKPQWAKSKGGANYLREWTSGDEFPPAIGAQPVVFVHATAAAEYAAWAGKRLPSEEEWEYAARAQTTGAYWWSGEFQPSMANNSEELWEVDRASTANPWGFFNMLGNVWEWTSTSPDRDAQRRIVRGGAFDGDVSFLRAAKRTAFNQSGVAPNVGFRCALSAGAR